MSTTLRSVLISDPVDMCCGELLARHDIPVTIKYKLSKEELIKELQVHVHRILETEIETFLSFLSFFFFD